MAAGSPRRAVFLDRDGVLIRLVERDGGWFSPRRLEEFHFVEGASDAVGRLRAAGLLAFVVSNQPDVARGHLDGAELDRMNGALRAAVTVDDVMVCPHDDADRCGCRKPKPGMILDLAERWRVSTQRSFVVGDTWRDAEAGRRAGCRTIVIGGDERSAAWADWTVAALPDAVRVIEAVLGSGGCEGNAVRS